MSEAKLDNVKHVHQTFYSWDKLMVQLSSLYVLDGPQSVFLMQNMSTSKFQFLQHTILRTVRSHALLPIQLQLPSKPGETVVWDHKGEHLWQLWPFFCTINLGPSFTCNYWATISSELHDCCKMSSQKSFNFFLSSPASLSLDAAKPNCLHAQMYSHKGKAESNQSWTPYRE